jgi:hypothetical protein
VQAYLDSLSSDGEDERNDKLELQVTMKNATQWLSSVAGKF